ncbi:MULTISPECIES: glycine cleavage system protein GcvH [Acetobacter]|uniref:glycine cleavage system protein GcvH n=1 Tax=Acetobacter TaxID=434 RepID=UPI000A391DCE|nr:MULTISPECIES: glycine cleavage system protein GcvH [Acetobacter]MBS0985806.1 glycine cleavage system protein GcvH [Acetobacter thailandicus]OUJ09603.1 glycine cleavage system protein H [Acetobacter sp. DsW_059]
MTLYFTQEHEWLRVDGDSAVVGITRHAADELGELVFVEVHQTGTVASAGDAVAVVESVKAASDIYAPVDGEILEGNAALSDDPARVSSDPEGEGWILKLRISNPEQLSALMDADAYAAFIG